MRNRLLTWGLALTFFAILAPANAEAQSHPYDVLPDGELGFELGFHTGEKFADNRATWFVPRVHGFYRVIPELAVGWDWSFIGGVIENVDDKVVLGNPYVSAHYLLDLDEVMVSLGGGLALPLARLDGSFPDTALANALYFGGTGMNGSMRGWQYAPEDFSIVASARVDARPSESVRLFGNIDAFFLLPTGEGDEETDFATQVQFGAMFPLGNIEMGARLNLFWAPSAEVEDDAQFSIEPMFRYNADGWRVDARFVANMDTPFGFSFDDGRYWGLFGGVTIEL